MDKVHFMPEHAGFLKWLGMAVNLNGTFYYHVPKWFKQLEGNEFEMLDFTDLPKEIQDYVDEHKAIVK